MLLQQTPFGGRVKLTLETDPERHGGFDDPKRGLTIVATRPTMQQQILGLADRKGHAVWIDGKAARLGYIGQLRRKPGERITIRRLGEGYRMFEQQRRGDEIQYDYTSILADNSTARRLLERDLPGLPHYQVAGRMLTLTSSTSRTLRLPCHRSVRILEVSDFLQALQFLDRHHQRRQLAPRLELSIFELPGIRWFCSWRSDCIDGCLALWDQRDFKRIRIHDYSANLARFRKPINLLRRLLGAPTLPAPGACLPLGFLSFLAVDDDQPDVISSLMATAATAAMSRGIGYLSLGLPSDHPALSCLKRALRPELTESIIYLVHPIDAPVPDQLPFLMELPVYPEIALL